MSIVKLQMQFSTIDTPTSTVAGTWRTKIYPTDTSNAFSITDISVGDKLIYNTSNLEGAESLTSFTITNIVQIEFGIFLECDIEYDNTNNNSVSIPSDFSGINLSGVVSSSSGSFGLLSTISPDIQQKSDYWAENLSNINLESLDSKLTGILGLDSNGDYVAQTSSDAVSILDDIQNLIQDIADLNANALVDSDFDSAGLMVTDGAGNYSITSISNLGAGDMLASLYDSNGDHKVNSADNADNANTVGGFTVGIDVPANAVFTDTIYTNSDVDLYLNSDSAGDGQVLSWDSAGNSYAWIDKGNTLFNISDDVQGVAVSAGSKLLTGDIEMATGSELTAAGCIINFGSSTIVGFNSVINHHIWEGTTKPTDGYVLSWDETLHANDGGYVWVDNPAPTGDSNRVVYDLTDPANSVILDAGDGINPATYYGDVIDNNGNPIVDVSSTSATFSGTLLGSVAGNVTTDDGQNIILDVGTDETNGILNIANITADGTVDFTGATVLGLDSAGYATSSDISYLQGQIDTIAGTDSALDTLTELITYIKDLEAADSAGELSLIQDIADLQANVLFDNDFDSAGLMVTDGAGNYSSITNNSSNWNTAYGWGDHGLKGYLTTTTWTLTAIGSSDYVFSGPGIESGNTTDPDIFLVRGQTYKFDNQSGGHPFEIRTSSGGSAYTSGVTQSGTVTTFTVPMDAPDKLYYQCTSHSSMLGNIIISDHSKSLVDNDFDSAGLMVTDGAGNYSVITDNSSNWDLAVSWGNHDSAGYLTTSDLQDVLVDNDFDSAGLMVTDGAGNYSSITNNSSNWNTAYEWGDHSLAGYSKVEISDNAPSNPTAGDLWWNSNEGNLKIYYGNDTDTAGDDIWVDASAAGYSGGSGGSSSSITDGTSSVSFNSTNDVVIDTDLNVNAINISGHILPSANAQFDLGNAEYKIRHLFLSDNSVYFGSENDSAGEMVQLTKSNVQRSVEIYNVGDDLNNNPLNPNPLSVPPQPNDPGRKGDIRTIGGYAYICIQDNQWVRFALEETW